MNRIFSGKELYLTSVVPTLTTVHVSMLGISPIRKQFRIDKLSSINKFRFYKTYL
jgi:hypothetical protein